MTVLIFLLKLCKHLKNDIIEVISHYMDINKNEMEISLENDDNSVALLANIPVNRIKNQAKR